MYLEAVIKRVRRCTWRQSSSWTQRCTWRPRSSVFGDAFCGQDSVTQRCSWRPWLSEFGDAFGSRDCVTQRCTCRLWSSLFWDALVSRDRVSQRCTWRPWSSEFGDALGGGRSGGSRLGGRCDGSRDSIHWLTGNHGNVESWVQSGVPTDERLAGSGRQLILGWCSTRCMHCSVYAVLGVHSWSLHGEIDKDDLTLCS